MEYVKTVRSGGFFEIYRYERRPRNGRANIKSRVRNNNIQENGEDAPAKPRPRREDSIKRSCRDFIRLVRSNLDFSSPPAFITLTFRENERDIRVAKKKFNSFARDIRREFGTHVRYIAVSERQKRGAIHFHTLFWGIPSCFLKAERSIRFVAGLWGLGFVDIVRTDGDPRIASYMMKYMKKGFESRSCWLDVSTLLAGIYVGRISKKTIYFHRIFMEQLSRTYPQLSQCVMWNL